MKFATSILILLNACITSAAGPRFSITYPASTFAGPFTGRAVVYFSKGSGEPRYGPNWFNPQPCYSAMFKAMKPGEAMVVEDGNAVGFPGRLSAVPAGDYSVQVVLDRNLGGRAIGESGGNLYSIPIKLSIDPSNSATTSIVCDQVIPTPEFKDSTTIKGLKVESKLLSKFYGRPTYLTGAVVLPEAYYKEPNRKFPTYYSVPGFGGNHWGMSGRESVRGTVRDGEPIISIELNPDCPGGHSVFADSANNGPWGKALTTELIPYVDAHFRTFADQGARYVGGHSSGGWSSVWLQVTYPEVFGGVWSTSPDPVDFRDFQLINLYKPGTNMFTDDQGSPRPLARFGATPSIWYHQFSDMERPIRGEQLASFEWVFSPRGRDGEPLKLWNRDTGAIDAKVAEAWRPYDIGLTLRTHWKELEPRLRGKLHVYMGDMDTFYLDGAVRLLQKDMAELKSDAKIDIVPGDHGSMMTAALRKRIDQEIAAQFRAWRALHPDK